ncbi:MAG: glycosyltransferase family 61 protein [Magnetococcus sp. MYC-9]
MNTLRDVVFKMLGNGLSPEHIQVDLIAAGVGEELAKHLLPALVMEYKTRELNTDIELSEFLQVAFAPEHPMKKVLHEVLEYPDRFVSVDSDDAHAGLNRWSARLLWLLSHYFAANAASRALYVTSHILQVGYIELGGDGGNTLASQVGELATALPTSVVLNVVRYGASQPAMHAYSCGGERTRADDGTTSRSFVKHADYVPDPTVGINHLGAMLVRIDDTAAGRDEPLRALISAQPVVAYVVVVRHHETPKIMCDAVVAENWEEISLGVGRISVDVYKNKMWTKLMQRPAFAPPPPKPFGQLKVVTPVDVTQAEGVRLLASFSAETLSGPESNEYRIDRTSGSVSKKSSKLSEYVSVDRNLYEYTDVNLSSFSTIWRGNHFFSAGPPTTEPALVSEPTTRLEGTYFLSPAPNTCFSHLIAETFKKLNFAVRFQPDIKLLASSELMASQRDFFQYFGFPPERCVYKHPDDTWSVERLISLKEPVLTFDRLSASYLGRVGMAHRRANAKWSNKIYVSRRDTRGYRNLVNANEIEKLFERYGFSVILLSELSAREKLEIFSSADYLAGPGGAAFWYMPLSQQGITPIILTTSFLSPPEYKAFTAIQMKPLNVIYGICMKMYSRAWMVTNSSFYMPPDLVSFALDDILNAK